MKKNEKMKPEEKLNIPSSKDGSSEKASEVFDKIFRMLDYIDYKRKK